MYLLLGLSFEATQLLIREQGLDSAERVRVLTDKNVDEIHNVVRKQGFKNDNGTSDKGQQDSVIAQNNLKQAVFLFHHRWRCTFDWKVTGVQKDTVHLLVGHKRLEDEYKDPDVPKVNKADMAGTMESIQEYLRSDPGVIRAIIRTAIYVQIYGNHSMYVTPDNKMIAKMLHIPSDKKRLHNEQSIQSVKEHTAEYERDNRSVYDILD